MAPGQPHERAALDLYGFSQLMRLRDKAEKRAGQKGLVERAYHDELLSFGSPAPRYLPRLMGLE